MTDKEKMEELLRRLKDKGLMNGWNDPKNPDKDINLSGLSILKNQTAMLEQLEVLLQQQLKFDTKTLDDLREKAERLKHGGGI